MLASSEIARRALRPGRWLAAVAAALLLTACVGGGSSNPSPTPGDQTMGGGGGDQTMGGGGGDQTMGGGGGDQTMGGGGGDQTMGGGGDQTMGGGGGDQTMGGGGGDQTMGGGGDQTMGGGGGDQTMGGGGGDQTMGGGGGDQTMGGGGGDQTMGGGGGDPGGTTGCVGAVAGGTCTYEDPALPEKVQITIPIPGGLDLGLQVVIQEVIIAGQKWILRITIDPQDGNRVVGIVAELAPDETPPEQTTPGEGNPIEGTPPEQTTPGEQTTAPLPTPGEQTTDPADQTMPGTPGTPAPQTAAIPDALIPDEGTGEKDDYFSPDCMPRHNTPSAGCYTDGDRDGDGTYELANIKSSRGSVYSRGVTLGHRRIEGSGGDGVPRLRVPNPPQDVRDAWRDGWTGDGVNILVFDTFGGSEVTERNVDRTGGWHGYTVTMAANEIAPGADFFFVDAGLQGGGTGREYGHFGDDPSSELRPGRDTLIHAINMSFGGCPNPDPPGGEQGCGTPTAPSPDDIRDYLADYPRRFLYQDLTGTVDADNPSPVGLRGTAEAVLVKAAGNNGGVDASWYLDNLALVRDAHTGPRALIVGALDHYARPTLNPVAGDGQTYQEDNCDRPNGHCNISTSARMASYSAFAGADAGMQKRFLVEYGGSPYAENAYLCQADVSPACEVQQFAGGQGIQGTSFAAPRVAGFAALVRDKFPGLNAAQTTKILLDTATTEGLGCHDAATAAGGKDHVNCDVETYGQGRVHIGNALSPLGKLD